MLAPVFARAPGFRPANFYSPYEAAVWSIVSARRPRSQGIVLRQRLAETYGTVVTVAGQPVPVVPDPVAGCWRSSSCRVCRRTGSRGCTPSPRPPQRGDLAVERLTALGVDAARTELQRLPGIGPFYSALIMVRACGLTDVLATEPQVLKHLEATYGRAVDAAELEQLAEAWRPWRTWVTVMLRALGGRGGPMPEGDTVWRACRRLHGLLAGEQLTRTEFRVPSLATTDLTGVTVRDVTPRGKHQLFRFDNGWTLHTHFRMEGAWRTYPTGRRWSGGPDHEIRAVLGTAATDAVGYRLPVVELLPTADEDDVVGHLGPDLLGPDWDADEALRRLRAQPETSIGEALLDQRNLAGLGTLYRSELLFLQGLHPRTAGGERSPPCRGWCGAPTC